ncbi:MAG: helix-turn-helix transcriptional regulator [Acidobacteria bacterium]|nr:helix-turn-helix transcriptional regulator [Acidobacteriota bacterium]
MTPGKLKQRRAALGFNQTQLGERWGMKPSAIARLEANGIGSVSARPLLYDCALAGLEWRSEIVGLIRFTVEVKPGLEFAVVVARFNDAGRAIETSEGEPVASFHTALTELRGAVLDARLEQHNSMHPARVECALETKSILKRRAFEMLVSGASEIETASAEYAYATLCDNFGVEYERHDYFDNSFCATFRRDDGRLICVGSSEPRKSAKEFFVVEL